MQIQEKRMIAEIISSVLTFGGYSVYTWHKYQEAGPDVAHDLIFWAKAFLMLIPVGVVAGIVIMIILSIMNKIVTGEEPLMVQDERDKLIELKAHRISSWIFIIGVFFSMGTIALGMPAMAMFIGIAIFGFITSVADSAIRLILYLRGF